MAKLKLRQNCYFHLISIRPQRKKRTSLLLVLPPFFVGLSSLYFTWNSYCRGLVLLVAELFEQSLQCIDISTDFFWQMDFKVTVFENFRGFIRDADKNPKICRMDRLVDRLYTTRPPLPFMPYCCEFDLFLKYFMCKGRVQKLKSAKVWSLTIEGGAGGVTKTKSLFRIAIYFKLLVCTAIHPICGEIVYWGS